MFGSLSSAHQIMVLLSLKGGPAYTAQMEAASTENNVFTKSLLKSAAAMNVATDRSFLHNQAMYTARRYAFYATLAITGLAVEVARLGFSYLSTVQSARVALKGMFPDKGQLTETINQLYKLSTLSPFLFKDTLTAFRTMAPAMKNAGISSTETLHTMKAVMDALSQSGRTSVGALTRVSVQLQHMANIGRPAGQIILALARDGLPVYPALRKELGLTGTALENLSSTGVTAQQVIKALDKFIETSPIYKGQAFKQATSTLQGNWQMFKDILSQASGRSVGGLFGGLMSRLVAVNKYLQPLFQHNKPIGMYDIAAAIDHSLSPSTHLILNLFIMFTTALKALVFWFGLVAKIIQIVLWPLDKLLSAFGLGHTVAKLFGGTLGTLAAIFLLGKLALLPLVLAIDLFKTAITAARSIAIAYRVVMLILNGEWAAATAIIMGNTAATTTNTTANVANATSEADRLAIMGALSDGIVGTTVATTGATIATDAWNVSLVTLLGTLGLVVGAVAAMYFVARHFHTRIGFGPNLNPQPATPQQQKQQHHFDKHQSWFSKTFGVLASGFASGGTVGSSGLAWVGENGPELMHLPAATKIMPMGDSGLAGMIHVTVEPQAIYLDGKRIGQALATAVTDKEARA